MKRLLVDGGVSRCFFATLTIVGFCLTSAACGQHPPASSHHAAGSEVGVHPGPGRQVANTVTSAIATLPDTTTAQPDTSLLRAVEQRVLPMPIVPGPNRCPELTDYYWAENRSLRDRFELAKQNFQQQPRPTFRALTLVAGSAGVGKTFIKKRVFNKDFPAKTTCKFDLRERYDAWAEQGFTIDKADLTGDGLVISRLKSVTDKSKPVLREYLEAQDANFYVIDSLDEIHPDDYAWVLEQVEEFVFHRDRQFVHVAIFGRGFAFRDFWQKRTEHRDETDVKLYLLNAPRFRTTGDLAVSSWNFHSWKYRLAWAPDGKETVSMPFDDYCRWVRSGFSREGTFRSITCEANEDMRADVQTALRNSACESRMTCSDLYSLAGNGIIREIVQQQTLAHRSADERRTAEDYLAAWLIRETKVHDRPSVEKPELLDLYMSLLRQVAVKYLADNKIDDQGFFPVGDADAVTVPHGAGSHSFPVRRVLERSGLVFTDPCEEGVAKYRFEPIWMHRLLVEMHSERLAERPGILLGAGAN